MPRFLALDAERGAGRLLAGSVKGGVVSPEAVLSWDEADGLSLETAVAIGHRLKEKLKKAGVAPVPLWLCVGRDRVVLKELRFPQVDAKEEPGLVRFQTVKDLTDSPDKVLIDYAPIPDPSSPQKRALVVVIRKDVLSAANRMAEAAGLKLAGVTVRPFTVGAALEQAVRTGAGFQIDGSTCAGVLTHGLGWGEFTVLRDGAVLFSRAIGTASLESESALIGEMKRNLTVFAAQNPGLAVDAIYVAEAEGYGGWVGRLRDGLPVPVEEFDPLAGHESETKPAERGHFAGLIGTLGYAVRKPPINFVSPREPVAERDPNKLPVVIAASLFGLVAVAGIAWGMVQRIEKDREIVRLGAEKARLDADLAGLELEKKRIDAVEDWESREIVWLDELYDLAERFPDIDRTRLEEFSAKAVLADAGPKRNGIAGLPNAPKKPKYVAQVTLTLDAKDARSVDQLTRSLAEEGDFYKGALKVAKGDGKYLVSAEIASREPHEYTRELAVDMPAEPDRRAEERPRDNTPLFPEAALGGGEAGGERPGGESARAPGADSGRGFGGRPGGFGGQPGGDSGRGFGSRPGGFGGQPGGFGGRPGGGESGRFGGDSGRSSRDRDRSDDDDDRDDDRGNSGRREDR